jgi:hypothetical protein
MAKKTNSKSAPNTELNLAEKSNFTIQLNELGEIVMNFSPEEINAFLDKKVKDKKLDNDIEDDDEENDGKS